MAITYVGQTTNTLNAATLNLPAATLAGDTIVVLAGSGTANWSNGSSTLPNNTAMTWTGHGGTVTSYALNSSTSLGFAAWVITNCNAGVTQITRSGSPASTTNGAYNVAQFSGVGSVVTSNSPILFTTTNNSTQTTFMNWSVGDLLLGLGVCFTWSTATGTWAGASDAAVGGAPAGTSRQPLIDYLVSSSSATGGAYVTPRSSPTQVLSSMIALTLRPATAAKGNFLSFT
jgi:hypothetical protein